MPIPPEINAIVQRLNQELSQVEQEASAAMSIVRNLLNRFPNNAVLTQMFALANSTLMFVSNRRQIVQDTQRLLEREDISASAIQSAGEELSQMLGQVIETKIRIIEIKSRLERML